LVKACLENDEAHATMLGKNALSAGKSPLVLYGSAKRALNRWCRRMAVTPAWAGSGVTLNAISFGVIETPAAAWILGDAKAREQMKELAPLAGAHPGTVEQAAALIGWCVSAQNSLVTGQVLFADGGFECLARGDSQW
jgi:NAD(P)-dependent dehydrogenase (short-subunit alcohol dehydrogenase family)